MNITWLGHACFCLESGGYRIVVDPYKMDSYPPLRVQAHAVYCTHQHFDHNYTQAVELLPARPSPFSVEEAASFHDERGGALRGDNTLFAFSAEGLRVIHCGDLGHEPDEAQTRFLSGADALILPVGGHYTIDAAAAKRIVDRVRPRAVIPMHYRHGEHGSAALSEVTAFTDLFAPEAVLRVGGNSVELDADGPAGVVVLRFTGPGEQAHG